MKLRATIASTATIWAALLSQGALAGASLAVPVQVGSNYAGGTFTGARYSGDTTQHIGCSLSTYVTHITDTSAHLYLACAGTDATGNTYYCYDYTPPDSWVKIVVALNLTSYVYFYGDSQHHCQGLTSSQNSLYF